LGFVHHLATERSPPKDLRLGGLALVTARMQYRPGFLDGFLAKTGLDLTLP
jgi:hypothetical protein